MDDKKIAIKVSTLDSLAEGFQESRGITDKLTTEQMIAFAKEPVASGENKLAQLVDGTITELTAEDMRGVSKIRASAFHSSPSLINVTIPNSVTSIGSTAFYSCYSLERITMGDGIMDFINAMNVFSGCNNLKAVYFDGDIGFWCRGFYGGNSNPLGNARKLYVKNSNGEYELLSNLIIPNSVPSFSRL